MSQANESCDKQPFHIQQNQCQRPTRPHVRIDWRHPIVGYLCVLPALAFTILLTLAMQSIVSDFVMPNTILVLTISFIALFWGKGPTLLVLILGTLLLDFLVIPPLGTMTLHRWPDIIQTLPLLLAGLLIAEITRQRQRHQQQLERATSALRQHAKELETLNMSLHAINQAKDQQFAVAAHELKTPLTALRLYTQWLQRQGTPSPPKSTSPERLTTACQKIEEQTQRLAILIEELLGGQLTLPPQNMPPSQPCDLTALCHRIVEHQCLITGQPITLAAPSAALTVSGYPHHFEQIFNNLITNAVKYSPEGCRVEVDLHQRENMARVSVHDAGPGIAPDQNSLVVCSILSYS